MYYAHTNENNVLIQTQTQAKVGKSDFSLVCLVRKLTLVMFRDSDKPKLLFCAIKLFNSEKCYLKRTKKGWIAKHLDTLSFI